MNFTSGDVALVASLDYVTVSCRISYFSTRYWIPHPECLPIVIGEREVINKTQRTIWFTKAFNVTPDIDGAVVECVVKFNRTAYDPRGIAHNAPLDVLLWKSTPLQVQCNHFLCFYYIFCEYCCTSPKCRHTGGLFLKAGSSECSSVSVYSKALLFLASIPAFYMPLQHAWPKWTTNFPIFPSETFVKVLLLSMRLVRTNYIPKHSLDHADSEYASHVAG